MQRRVIYQALAFVPVIVAAPVGGDANLAFATTSAQVINKTVIYEPSTTYAQTPVETITADKWFAQLSTPVRRRSFADQQDFAQTPHTPFALAWARSLDTPALRKRSLSAQQGLGYLYFPEAAEEVTVDKWYVALDIPTRSQVSPSQLGYAQTVFTPVAADTPGDANLGFVASSWQVVSKTIVYEPDAHTPYVPVEAETVTIDKWWRELAVPVRRKQVPDGRHAASLTFVAPAPGAGTAYNWFLPLEIPTRARKLYEFPATAIPVYFVPPTPGSGLELNWWPTLNEPVRPKRYVASQQSLTVPPRLLTVTLEYAWHQRLSEPTRLKIAVGRYPAIVHGNVYPVEIVTADKWFRELARPIYKKRIDRPALTQSNINPVVSYAWHQLHTPLRIKGRIEYPAHTRALYPFAFAGPGVGLNQPWPALSEPVRFSARIRPGQQQFLSVPSLIISSDLDPACRVMEVLEFSGVIESEGMQDVVVEGDADVVAEGDADLTPEPGGTIKVEC